MFSLCKMASKQAHTNNNGPRVKTNDAKQDPVVVSVMCQPGKIASKYIWQNKINIELKVYIFETKFFVNTKAENFLCKGERQNWSD